MTKYSEETRRDALLDVVFATVLGDNLMRQEKLYEICIRFMDEIEKRGIHVLGFTPVCEELRIQAYRAAIEDARDYDLVWLERSGFVSRMTPRAAHLICNQPGVLSEEELLIAREAVEVARMRPDREPPLRKASEVADANLDGLPALKMRNGEPVGDFAERLYAALHGENDLPRTSSK